MRFRYIRRPLVVVLAAAGMVSGGVAVELARGPVVEAQAAPAVRVPIDGKPFKTLSEYGFFKGEGATQDPADGVLPYDLTTPLFSDYSTKFRFVWMPEGTAATYASEDVFAFPVGAALIKTFAFDHDLRDPAKGRKLIETRLLIHQTDGWKPFVYVWNDEQTEAVLKVAGGRSQVAWIHTDGEHRTLNYVIPNLNQCKGCHIRGEAILPIGPKGRNINHDFTYDTGVANQLAKWSSAGYLTGAPDPAAAPALPTWDDPATGTVSERARAYLDVNCAHCHNPNGPANTTGVDFSYQQEEPYRWSVGKVPTAAGRGSGDRMYGIVAGDPDKSILVYRLESTEPGIMMPELPRLTVHEEGAALIRQWITEMKPAS